MSIIATEVFVGYITWMALFTRKILSFLTMINGFPHHVFVNEREIFIITSQVVSFAVNRLSFVISAVERFFEHDRQTKTVP